MKKSGKIALTIFAILFALIGVFVTVCIGIAQYANDDATPTAEMSSWMSYIKDETLLKDVVIAGSHDSGCEEMMWMTKTQDLPIKQQLACGTRYFDIRVCKEDGELTIFHDIIRKGSFMTILEDITAFIKANPTETLVLDFQKFEDDVELEVASLVENYLAGMLVEGEGDDDTSFINSLTLADCRGKCVVFWGKASGEEFEKPFIFMRNNDSGTRAYSTLQSYYTSDLNGLKSAEFIEKGLSTYLQMRKQNLDGLFVLQGQLTDLAKIFGPKLLEATHTDKMDDYVKSLATSPELEYINIIMRDFVTPHKNALTISLNLAKGNVKQDCVEQFNLLIEQNA